MSPTRPRSAARSRAPTAASTWRRSPRCSARTRTGSGTHRANLTGSIAVFDAARRAKNGGPVPVVYASSAATYGDAPDLPLTEASPTRPLTAYGADKLGSELHARVAGVVHGVPTSGMRFFNVYGPRQDPKSPYSGVISVFADRVRSGQSIGIQGDGKQTRDFVFVADVVRHLLAAMATSTVEARVFNVCTGRATSILELAHALMAAASLTVEVRHGPARAGDIRESSAIPPVPSPRSGSRRRRR